MNVIHERLIFEFKQLYQRLLNEGNPLPFDQILDRVTNYLEVICPATTQQELKLWHDNIAHHLFLSTLVEGDDFEELVFFGQNFVTKDGIVQDAVMLNHDDFVLAWTQLAFDHGIEWNHAHPFASFAVTVHDRQTRITLVHPCCSPDQQMRAFVRMHTKNAYRVEDFCCPEITTSISQAINDKHNILVVGATQSGKTTLMRAMLNQVDPNEHVVILEDTHELVRKSTRTTSLLAAPSDTKRSLSEYCAMALRMSPDRIVLGEIRSNEVVPLILAFNSGHRGGISSLHADGVEDALERLALLFHLYSQSADLPHNKVMDLICRNIDWVIFIKDKKVLDMAKVIGSENGVPLYESSMQNAPTQTHEAIQWWQQ